MKTIKIDNKTIEISEESYNAFKEQFLQKEEQKYFAIYDDATKTTQEIFEECEKEFKGYQYKKFTCEEFPKPKLPTLRYFKKNIEADEEFKNKSADDLEKENHKGITLRERLLMELQYFKETGNNLDVDNITLCSGSRDSDGGVPRVYWGGDELRVYWGGASDSAYILRSRSAVTLDPFNL